LKCVIGLGVLVVSALGWIGCSGGAEDTSREPQHLSSTSEAQMPGGPRGYIVTASSQNTSGNSLRIDAPPGLPDAGVPSRTQTIALTQVWNPGGVGGTYNPHHVGVWFDGTSWWIYNEDGAAMPKGASFAVAFIDMLQVTAVAAGKQVPLTGPSATDPSALFLLTHVWDPPGEPGVYENHEIAAQLLGQTWTVTTADGASGIAASASFNALPPASSAFLSVAKQVQGNFTLIDNPLTNGNPNAVVFITQNLSPGGTAAPAVSSPLGVWYDGAAQKWSVFTEDVRAMPMGAAFNVALL
jgi:hypothetical protein